MRQHFKPAPSAADVICTDKSHKKILMKTPAEELGELMDVGGVQLGQAPKYSRRQPVSVERAVRLVAARGFLDRLAVGQPMTVHHSVVAAVKLVAKERPGVKISAKSISAVSAKLTRTS